MQRKDSASQEIGIDSENRLRSGVTSRTSRISPELNEVEHGIDHKVVDKISEPAFELDQRATIQNLEKNLAISEFCTEGIKENQEFSGQRKILMFNFSFLLKASFAQILFVALANHAITALIFLALTELAFLAYNVGVYLKHRHLKSLLLLVPRVI